MRIFFGATLPENTKAQIEKVQEGLRILGRDARMEPKDKLHITLHFIGDFDRGRVNSLFSAVTDQIKKSWLKASSIEVGGANYFPDEKIRRGIWVDCQDDGTLAVIADSIQYVASQFGVAPEKRRFKPHITIARFRGDVDISRKNSIDLQKLWSDGKLSIERFFPKGIALFESTLKSSGSEYKILSDIPLNRE
jgi:2'-5' RNA ligase